MFTHPLITNNLKFYFFSRIIYNVYLRLFFILNLYLSKKGDLSIMKRFTAFSFILTAAILLIGYVALWSPQIYAHTDLGTSPVFKITENTQGPVRLNLSSGNPYTYAIASTDADSQKFEISPEKRGPNQKRWQELQFKSDNVPDYENPADADTDNDYKITLAYGTDGVTHNHDVTIRVTDVKAPDKMSAPTLKVLATKVKVSWTAVSHAALTGYEVHSVNTSDTSDTASETVEDVLTSTTLTSLTGGNTYDIKVRALTSEGNSEWSDTAQVTANGAPTLVDTIPAQVVAVGGGTATINALNYFSDPDGQALHISVSSSNATVATVTEESGTLTITGKALGTATITVTATDPFDSAATQTIAVSVKNPPTAVGTIPNISGAVNQAGKTFALSPYFSEPNGQTLAYSASSSNTYYVSVYVNSSNELEVTPRSAGNATVTVTATNADGLSATQSFSVSLTPSVFVGEADAIPSLSSQELSQLGALLTYNTVIFNELYNGSDDTTDWLELRNVSAADLALDDWELTIRTGEGHVVVSFPAGTVIPVGEVLLLTNTEMPTADASVLSVVAETFALPQTDFALILRDPIAFGDITGNYVQDEGESPQTVPALTVNTTWERTQPIVFGYRAEAWTESTYQDGLGTPGYRHPDSIADLNSDGVVNILDLVLVASQFGTTNAAADLNADGTVDMDDLVFVANAWGSVAGAPTAGTVNVWLQLARQNESVGRVERSETGQLPEGFSYTRGIEVLEQLARALTPETTALLANYPNPFNPETWIPYQLSKAADVTINIYASDGNVVRTLALGHQKAGMYKHRTQAAYWDGKNALGESVASGLYFYTLTAGDFTATRRMLILK